MLRQLRNLRDLGRIRTSPRSFRRNKPQFLVANPELEFGNLLEFFALGFGNRHEDFYFVQIGAFDGVDGDPLNDLVNRHQWAGVLVEPQRAAFEKLQRTYHGFGRLRLLNVAIGPEDGETTIYTRKSGPISTASMRQEFLIKPGRGSGRSEITAERVTCLTPRTLLREAGAPDRIDLVQIDAEGFDFEIIKAFDLDAVRPRIIRYEHILLSETDKNRCLAHLAAHGYRFLLEDSDTLAVLTD